MSRFPCTVSQRMSRFLENKWSDSRRIKSFPEDKISRFPENKVSLLPENRMSRFPDNRNVSNPLKHFEMSHFPMSRFPLSLYPKYINADIYRTTYPLGIGPLILWESDQATYHLGSGTFSWGTGHSILWERFYPLGIGPLIDTLGIGPLILWDSGHPLGNGIWETEHAILWNRTTYSLGNILWESGIWEMRYNR